ncbi:hypothetical protein FBU30_000291 [Linnemannia zychae]|nr:hypothetical protein FBU30_000291 [Linnemannia zychae]
MVMFSQLAYWKTYFTSDRYSMSQIPDLSGKVAIVTGANRGLGYTTAVALAGHGAHVILACRSQKRALQAIKSARAEIRVKYPLMTEPKMEFMELDLTSMSATQEAAKKFLERGLDLHILVCNAGIKVVPGFSLSSDGVESHFAINHMGHFIFTTTLLDRIKASQPSRIVILSSLAHDLFPPRCGINFDTLNDPSATNYVSRYGRAKLANVLFTKALARRMANERVYVNAVHPGIIPDTLVPEDDSWKEWFECLVKKPFAMTPEAGALSQIYAATSPEIEEKDMRGRYFIPVANEIESSAMSKDEALQEKLWSFSENLMREKIKA